MGMGNTSKRKEGEVESYDPPMSFAVRSTPLECPLARRQNIHIFRMNV